MINIDIYKLIALLLPQVLRQPIHIAWLKSLLTPIITEWQSYTLWHKDKLYEAHVTSQTVSMQAYLNRLFDPILKRIKVSHGATNEFYISLWSETSGPYILADDGIFLSLEGEINSEVLDGFIVEVPQGIDQIQVTGVVEAIKAVGVSYEIKVNTK